MKKGEIYEGIVEKTEFPNKGIVTVEDRRVAVKNTLPGQKIRFRLKKVRKGVGEGQLLQILEPAANEITPVCPHFANCGGCTWQNLSYEDQRLLKEGQLKELLDGAITAPYVFEGVKGSPRQLEYRNKMEFSFGDEEKDGPLALGMHKRGSFYDIVTADKCQIVDADFRKILCCVLEHFEKKGLPFYHRLRHTGYLRHLLVRKAANTGEILVDLITTTQHLREDGSDYSALAADQSWAEELRALVPPEGPVLVLGVGNRRVTADALGPRTTQKIFVTMGAGRPPVQGIRPVAAVAPGVSASTGLSLQQLAGALVREVRPTALICVDSLCSSEPQRLGRTLQFSDAGLCPAQPGSTRHLDTARLGLPVIAAGIPTLMAAQEGKDLVVTPRELDSVIAHGAALLGAAINRALQPRLSIAQLCWLAG